MNRYRDNLTVLREEFAAESMHLIFLDPPFNSKRDNNVLLRVSTALHCRRPQSNTAAAPPGVSPKIMESFVGRGRPSPRAFRLIRPRPTGLSFYTELSNSRWAARENRK